MASQGHVDARSKLFGEVAELYDAGRPGYSDAMVTEVLAYAALGDRAAASRRSPRSVICSTPTAAVSTYTSSPTFSSSAPSERGGRAIG